MRSTLLFFSLYLAAAFQSVQAKPLLGGLKTISVDAAGNVSEIVVKTDLGQGSYIKGAKKVAVPLVAVAFESSAKAKTTRSSGGTTTTKSLESHLLIDEKVLQAIADELQSIVEKDLVAEGFELLPKESIDAEARWIGIAKNEPIGAEVGDNFMSGFGGNGIKNRWYTSGNRPLFGTGATGPLSELSPLIRTAREKKISLLLYRFKIQFTSIDAANNLFVSYVKGTNILHMLSADVSVFTPENTLGTMIKLKADLTAGSDYVQEVRELPKEQAENIGLQMSAILNTLSRGATASATSGKNSGHYAIVANPERFKEGSLLLIKATSRQFAQVLRRAQ